MISAGERKRVGSYGGTRQSKQHGRQKKKDNRVNNYQ